MKGSKFLIALILLTQPALALAQRSAKQNALIRALVKELPPRAHAYRGEVDGNPCTVKVEAAANRYKIIMTRHGSNKVREISVDANAKLEKVYAEDEGREIPSYVGKRNRALRTNVQIAKSLDLGYPNMYGSLVEKTFRLQIADEDKTKRRVTVGVMNADGRGFGLLTCRLVRDSES